MSSNLPATADRGSCRSRYRRFSREDEILRLKLNLGCGDRYADGWTNIDYGTPHRVDEVVDLTGDLPWPPRSVAWIYAGHVLEHLTLDECRKLLKSMLVCTMNRGELVVVGPDVNLGRELLGEVGSDQFGATLDSLRFGAGRWSGDVHLWECTVEQIVELLTETGWGDVRDIGIDGVSDFWPVADRRPRWQCAVAAKRLD